MVFETRDARAPEGVDQVRRYRLGRDHGALALDPSGEVVWRLPGHDFGRNQILEGVGVLTGK